MIAVDWRHGELLQIQEDRNWVNYQVTERIKNGLTQQSVI